jgi:hypothetical protein
MLDLNELTELNDRSLLRASFLIAENKQQGKVLK